MLLLNTPLNKKMKCSENLWKPVTGSKRMLIVQYNFLFGSVLIEILDSQFYDNR